MGEGRGRAEEEEKGYRPVGGMKRDSMSSLGRE